MAGTRLEGRQGGRIHRTTWGLLRNDIGLGVIGWAPIEQRVLIDDEFVAGVFDQHRLFGVHANGIAGAGFDAESAVNAQQQVDIKNLRPLFDVRVFGLFGNDFNAAGGAGGGAHKAGDTTGITVGALHQAVARAVILRQVRLDLGVIEGFQHLIGLGQGFPGVADGQGETFDDLDKINLFGSAEFGARDNNRHPKNLP